MEMYKFIAWADIHHDEHGAKCITIDDTVKLEQLILKRALEGKFDFTVFCGDRFLKREPHDEVKVRADRVFEKYSKICDIPHYHLIGNHDWVDATMRWHTSESIRKNVNINILDRSETSTFKSVRIHSLPADFKMDMSKYQIGKDCFNLFLFHDALRGCYLDENQTQEYDGGLDSSLIDCKEFDLVLAGDIHVRQKFKLKNTQGGYLGSAIQRTKADSNVERGWTEYTVSRSAIGQPWKIEEFFQPIRNYFTRVAFNVTPDTVIDDLVIPESQIIDQLVEVKLVGEKGDVDRLADDDHWNKLKRQYNARRVDILRGYSAERYEEACQLDKAGTVIDDIEAYLASNFSSIGSLSKGSIIEKVNELRGV